jgi:hypothetical protein
MFFRHAGQRVKMWSFTGFFYTKEYEQILKEQKIFKKGLGKKFGVLNAISILVVVVIVILLGIGLYTNAVDGHFSVTQQIVPDSFAG